MTLIEYLKASQEKMLEERYGSRAPVQLLPFRFRLLPEKCLWPTAAYACGSCWFSASSKSSKPSVKVLKTSPGLEGLVPLRERRRRMLRSQTYCEILDRSILCLLGWRPPLLRWRPSLLGWRPSILSSCSQTTLVRLLNINGPQRRGSCWVVEVHLVAMPFVTSSDALCP